MRFPDGPAAQVFFPATEIEDADRAAEEKSQYPYMRPEAFDGLVSWLRKPKFIMKSFGIHRWHTPCSPTATPIEGGSFPVILFSHGLGGHSDVHAALSQLLARKGYVVIVFEHECRAASYARTDSGTVLTYDRPRDLTKAERKQGYELYLDICQKFRSPFLEHREQESVSFSLCLLSWFILE